MSEVAAAFRVLGILVNLNGRRLQKAALQNRWRWIPVQEGSPMLTAHMGKRAERRKIQGKKFRPVYGYRGLDQ